MAIDMLLSGAGASVDDLTTSLGSTVGGTVDGLVTTLTGSSGITSALTGDESALSGLLNSAVVGSDENDGDNPLGDLLADKGLLDSLLNLDDVTDVSGLLSDEGLVGGLLNLDGLINDQSVLSNLLGDEGLLDGLLGNDGLLGGLLDHGSGDTLGGLDGVLGEDGVLDGLLDGVTTGEATGDGFLDGLLGSDGALATLLDGEGGAVRGLLTVSRVKMGSLMTCLGLMVLSLACWEVVPMGSWHDSIGMH